MLTSAFDYHLQSSYTRHRLPVHVLDWENQPRLSKAYPQAPARNLPNPGGRLDLHLSQLLTQVPEDTAPPTVLDLPALAGILERTCRTTRSVRAGDSVFYYRSIASAGALYPSEIYLEVDNVGGLEPGLYHYAPQGRRLLQLRPLAAGPSGRTATAGPRPRLRFFLSAIFFRSAWKYRQRAYRYVLLDTGHLLENLLLALRAAQIPPYPTLDFADGALNHYLGLDAHLEACLARCDTFAPSKTPEAPATPPLPPAFREASRVAARETSYAAIEEVHDLASATPETRIRPSLTLPLRHTPREWIPVGPVSAWPEVFNYDEVLLLRRSHRNYIPRPLARDAFRALLEALRPTPAADPPAMPAGDELLATALLVNTVQDVPPGFYLYEKAAHRLAYLHKDPSTAAMARCCLNQEWLAPAALHLLLIADLRRLEEAYGARGYRYALLAAGRLGQRTYLAATSMGLGCCGIGAFYDPEVSDLLTLQESCKLLYLLAVGPVKAVMFPGP